MEERVSELEGLRKELVADGFTDGVVLGMGGSSLAPEVFRQTFGAPKGALNVHVLDTTDPAAIAALEQTNFETLDELTKNGRIPVEA